MSEMGKNTLPRPGRQGAFSMGAPGPGPAPGYQKWLPGKPSVSEIHVIMLMILTFVLDRPYLRS